MNAEQILAQVAEEVRSCQRCPLHRARRKAVPGEGPADAEIMFIGEAPGFHENVQGRPFVGAAGQFLDELLHSIGLRREEVYITNVVKCRPPGNRDPEPEELAACEPYLDRQIKAIRPKVIVTLGRFSMAKFIRNAKISQIHGKPVKVRGQLVVPMYHPAAALHQPSLRRVVEADFARLPDIIRQAAEIPESVEEIAEEKPSKDKPQQLSLF